VNLPIANLWIYHRVNCKFVVKILFTFIPVAKFAHSHFTQLSSCLFSIHSGNHLQGQRWPASETFPRLISPIETVASTEKLKMVGFFLKVTFGIAIQMLQYFFIFLMFALYPLISLQNSHLPIGLAACWNLPTCQMRINDLGICGYKVA